MADKEVPTSADRGNSTEEKFKELIKKLWTQLKLQPTHTGERIYLAKAGEKDIYLMLSQMKTIKIDHLLTEDETRVIAAIWPIGEKILVVTPPLSVHESSRPALREKSGRMENSRVPSAESSDRFVTLNQVQQLLTQLDIKHQQRTDEYLGKLITSQREFLDKQAEANRQSLESVAERMFLKFETLQPKTTGETNGKILHLEGLIPPIITEVTEQSHDFNIEVPPRSRPRIISEEIVRGTPLLTINSNKSNEETSASPKTVVDRQPTGNLEKENISPENKYLNEEKSKTDETTDKRLSPKTITDNYHSKLPDAPSVEEGEIVDDIGYKYMEDNDTPDDKRPVRINLQEELGKEVREIPEKTSDVVYNKNPHNTEDENGVSKLDLTKYIDDKVNSILAEKQNTNLNSNSIANLADKIQIEISNKDSGTNRNYKLLINSKFDVFEDYLISELKTKKLDYVLDQDLHKNVKESKLTDDRHRVRDIIINHIDMVYYSRIVDLREPSEIIAKLKEFKRLETRTTRLSARRDLYNIKYNSSKESAAEFWDKFEDKVRIYENIPEAGKLPEKEKRDLFIQAVIETVPDINVADCVCRESTGREMSYAQLKNYILQVEATLPKREPPRAAMTARSGFRQRNFRGRVVRRGKAYGETESRVVRCYSCGKNGHISDECPTPGQVQCYNCNKTGSYIAKNCPARKRYTKDSFEGQEPKRRKKEDEGENRPSRSYTRSFGNYQGGRGDQNDQGGNRGRGGRRSRGGRGSRGGCDRQSTQDQNRLRGAANLTMRETPSDEEKD